jgi:hypothetical protein
MPPFAYDGVTFWLRLGYCLLCFGLHGGESLPCRLSHCGGFQARPVGLFLEPKGEGWVDTNLEQGLVRGSVDLVVLHVDLEVDAVQVDIHGILCQRRTESRGLSCDLPDFVLSSA